MAALTSTIIAGLALATAAVGTTYAISSGQSAKKAGKTAREVADSKQKSLEDAFYKKEEQNDADASQTNLRSRQKTQKQLAAAEGRNSTILTSPLGVPGDAGAGSKKTVLGN
jgi:hypothetical protein